MITLNINIEIEASTKTKNGKSVVLHTRIFLFESCNSTELSVGLYVSIGIAVCDTT